MERAIIIALTREIERSRELRGERIEARWNFLNGLDSDILTLYTGDDASELHTTRLEIGYCGIFTRQTDPCLAFIEEFNLPGDTNFIQLSDGDKSLNYGSERFSISVSVSRLHNSNPIPQYVGYEITYISITMGFDVLRKIMRHYGGDMLIINRPHELDQ
jgi:hypothetical protein